MILWIMLGAIAVLLGGGLVYARLIGRALGEQSNRSTPAVLVNDGRDYVPTRTPVVFAHHFASIAGAGPIIGPVLARLYGWGPALAWLLGGAVLLGGVHDYVALHITMREGGRNLTVVARRTIGRWAFVMMLILLVALLALVCAAFLDLSAVALVSTVPAAALQLPAGQTLFVLRDGQAAIGGIAFTSVQYATLPIRNPKVLNRPWWSRSGWMLRSKGRIGSNDSSANGAIRRKTSFGTSPAG